MSNDLSSPKAGRWDVMARLSIMMFLQYAVWGAWLPIAARYLGGPEVDVKYDLSALAAAMAADARRADSSFGKSLVSLTDNTGKPAFSEQARKALSGLVAGSKLNKSEADALARAVNDSLGNSKLYKPEDFTPGQLTPKARDWLARKEEQGKSFPDSGIRSLNNSLLESAYPRIVKTGPGGLGFTVAQFALILGLAGSIGAVCAPFIAGQVADRYFSAQRFLALLLVLGGAIKWYTAGQTSYTAWLWLSIVYSIVYMPTLALSNSVAFAHMNNQERQFPHVRVWGTIGWIAASWAFPLVWLMSTLHVQFLPPFYGGQEADFATHRLVLSLKFAAVISFGYAAYCLFLPNTPPKKEGVERLAFAKAFRLLRKPSFLVIFLASLPISVIHQVYFLDTPNFLSAIGLPDNQIMPAMSIGQFAEIGVMALLGLMLTRLGFRPVIFIGTLAYVLRYAVFGTVGLPPALIVGSQVLHGFCYACFFAASYIYVDRIAPPDIRHSAQTLYGIFILGIGPVLAGIFLGYLHGWYTVEGAAPSHKYIGIWYTQAAIALVTGLLFLLMFRSEVSATDKARRSEAAEKELAQARK